jgi:hypothetical protein
MHLNVSLSYGKGGTGDMFQIDSVQDADTGRHLTTAQKVDVGRHFQDRADLAGYLCEKFGSDSTFEIIGEYGGTE